MDFVILNLGQVTRMTPELAPPLLTTTPHQWEGVRALDRFNMHRFPTRWVFRGTGLELMTRQPRSDALTTRLPRPHEVGHGSLKREASTKIFASLFLLFENCKL
ncbi:uncharacterized protein TNCV_1295091 [Trichonephila clavipes]|nr:uncharacterized protein TNCV_1295091 [Trichonephila clavipes]